MEVTPRTGSSSCLLASTCLVQASLQLTVCVHRFRGAREQSVAQRRLGYGRNRCLCHRPPVQTARRRPVLRDSNTARWDMLCRCLFAVRNASSRENAGISNRYWALIPIAVSDVLCVLPLPHRSIYKLPVRRPIHIVSHRYRPVESACIHMQPRPAVHMQGVRHSTTRERSVCLESVP